MDADGISRMPVEMLVQTVARNPYIPDVPWEKQIQFLELECLDALYGGAGSGGKSSGLLMAALQFIQVRGYAALIVRRNFSELKMPGGLIDRSLTWLKGKAHYNAQEHRWRFKEGSTLQFGYADNEGDERRYDGTEFQFIGLDEAVGFTERQIVYFYERLRRVFEINVPLRMRLATTPGGVGHKFLKERYIDPGTPGKVYVPATVWDNAAVDASQYMESLEEIKRSNPLRYRQMLLGDWDAVEGGRFKREWFGWYRVDKLLPDTMILTTYGGEEVERFRPDHCGRFQTCDPAASTSAAADYFVLSTWLVTPRANVVWLGCVRDKFEIQEQVGVCQREYRRYRPQFVAVEEVLNQRALAQLLRRSTSPVMIVKSVSPRGQNKLDHAAGFIALAASGRVFLPEKAGTFPLDDVVDEIVRFTGEKGKDSNDDCIDVGSYMAEVLPLIRAGWSGGGRAPVRHEFKVGPYDGLR